ncbi:hypothetical protein ACFLYB_01460 [Chloroflexota bacterium]
MQQGKSYRSIPTSVIFLVIGAIIFPIPIYILSNYEGGVLVLVIPGFLISIICMGVGVVLVIIDLLENYRKKRASKS